MVLRWGTAASPDAFIIAGGGPGLKCHFPEKDLGQFEGVAMDQLFEVELELAPEGSRESSRLLYVQLKAAILEGRLAPGTRLPATRSSKAYFGVSRNTLAEVYERLLNEGCVVARQGSGTYVAESAQATPAPVSAAVASAPDPRLNDFWLRPDVTAAMGFWQDPPQRSAIRARVDFRPSLVDSRLFPFDVFRRVSARELRGLERRPASYKSPQGNQGNYFLRDGIVKHIALTRSVACRPDEVIVTAGAQQAFDLLARTLVTAQKTVVAIEDPGYPPMRVAFAAAGAKLVPVGIDAEGLIVDDLPRDAGVVCVCPSHQFPMGVTMSGRRRKALVEFARVHGAVIVEDDYDGEFRYDGSFVQALRTADAADVVFYVGTFSKCMLPALRLGYIVAPDWAIRALTAAKNCLDWHCPTPVQAGVAAFIAGGHLTRHIRRMRQIYKRRRQIVLSCINGPLAEWLDPIPSFYGMHVAARTHAAGDLERVVEAMHRARIKIHTFRRYYLDAPREEGLIFGYAAADVPDLAHGLGILQRCLSGRDLGG
jgi:GntR family transcriptional regulator/MocR family aminotransferase